MPMDQMPHRWTSAYFFFKFLHLWPVSVTYPKCSVTQAATDFSSWDDIERLGFRILIQYT